MFFSPNDRTTSDSVTLTLFLLSPLPSPLSPLPFPLPLHQSELDEAHNFTTRTQRFCGVFVGGCWTWLRNVSVVFSFDTTDLTNLQKQKEENNNKKTGKINQWTFMLLQHNIAIQSTKILRTPPFPFIRSITRTEYGRIGPPPPPTCTGCTKG